VSFLTSSIVSLFASQDTQPVIAFTSLFANDYRRRMQLTIDWMNEILAAPKEKSDFIHKNYKRSVDLGLMHLDLSQAVKIKWNPKVRVPASQQAFAYMFYAFAWQPVEAMIATHEIDPEKDAKSIGDWLYLWHVLGYGMGMDARLLPQDVEQVRQLLGMLRAAQYPGPGTEIPHQVRTLLRGEMGYLYFLKGQGMPIDDPTKLEVRKQLAAQISYSPGLSKALGLGDDPLKGLQVLTDTID
jgi:hypothetical protein